MRLALRVVIALFVLTSSATAAEGDALLAFSYPDLVAMDPSTGAITQHLATIGYDALGPIAVDRATARLFSLQKGGAFIEAFVVTLDLAQGTAETHPLSVPANYGELVFNPGSGTLVATTDESTPQLVSIDPATGTVAPLFAPGVRDVDSLTFDDSGRRLFFMSGWDQTIYTFDVTSRVVTSIPLTPATTEVRAVRFDAVSQRLIGVSRDDLVSIDPGSGSATRLAGVGAYQLLQSGATAGGIMVLVDSLSRRAYIPAILGPGSGGTIVIDLGTGTRTVLGLPYVVEIVRGSPRAVPVNDVSLSMTVSGSPAIPGDTLDATLKVTASLAGSNCALDITSPAGTTVSKIDPPPGWSCTGLHCTAAPFATSPAVFSVKLSVSPAARAGRLTMSAAVTASAVDTAPQNNLAYASIDVITPSVLVPVKSVSRSPAVEGDMVTWTILVKNVGRATQYDNSGPEFFDVLPNGVTLSSATATTGTLTTSGNGVWWNGSIAAGESVTIVITSTVDRTGGRIRTLTNQATVYFDASGTGWNSDRALSEIVTLRVLPTVPLLSPPWLGLMISILALIGVAAVKPNGA